jgi:dihydrofolate reductase
MGKLKANIAISVDGYVAGLNQSEDNPIGEGGMQLHEWMFPLAAFRESQGEEGGEVNASSPIVEAMFESVGAVIMGRNMFGPVRAGGTTFHFVTDGIESALERANEAAGEKDVMIAGGASAIRQYLAAGLLDEIDLHLTPVVLGAGERLFEDVGDLKLEPLRAVEAPGVAHPTYRVVN